MISLTHHSRKNENINIYKYMNTPNNTTLKTTLNKALDAIDLMRKKIPVFAWTIEVAVTTHVFEDCPPDLNLVSIFWGYYITTLLLCGIWESVYSWMNFPSHAFPQTKKNRIIYTIFHVLVSLIAFISTSYYIQEGLPFSCIFPYNKTIATIIFYITYGVVVVLGIVEHLVLSAKSEALARLAVYPNA